MDSVVAPQSKGLNPPLPLIKYLRAHPDTQFIKWFWISLNGFLYVRTTTKSRSLSLASTSSPIRVHVSCVGGFTPINTMDPIFVTRVGKTNICADWKSLRMISPTHAAVQCWVSENLSLYKSLAMPSPRQRCPRSCLERVLTCARERHSLVFLVGFELEFYLVESFEAVTGKGKAEDPLSSKDQHLSRTWSSAACMRGPLAGCVEECMLALEAAGLVIEQGHSECSPNQFEICVGPLPPVAAADALVCAKEIIKEVSGRCGLFATFLPKPFPSREPVGLHLHLSVHEKLPLSGQEQEQEELEGVDQLTHPGTRAKHAVSRDKADAFLAGILDRFSMLCAFSLPTMDSYARTSDQFVIGRYVAWGRGNMSVAVNEVSTGYWEIRSLDWAANIYLAIAAFVSAGLLGIREGEKLHWRDPGALMCDLDDNHLRACSIVDPVPRSFGEAVRSLTQRQYGGLEEYLGGEILDLYVIVKEKEHEYLGTVTEEERRALLAPHF